MTQQFVPSLPNSSPQMLNASGAFNAALIDPTKFTFFCDDFTGCLKDTSSGNASPSSSFGLIWDPGIAGSSSMTLVAPADTGCIGSLLLTTGATNGNVIDLVASYTVTATSQVPMMCPLNDKLFDLRWKAAISSTSTITAQMGFSDIAGPKYISIRYDTSAGDSTWTGVCSDGTTVTATITGSVLDTNYHTFRIRSLVAGTILFSVDGGAEVSISTHVPTVTLCPNLSVATLANSARTMKVDYYWGWIALAR